MILVAEGGASDFTALGQYEQDFAEGSRGVLRLETRLPIPGGASKFIDEQLSAKGVALWGNRIAISDTTAEVYFEKRLAPLVIIAIAVAAAIGIFALISAWKLYRVSEEVIKPPAEVGYMGLAALPWIIGIGALLVVLLLAYQYKPKWW